MLIFDFTISKCPTYQLIDVRAGWTDEIPFVCSSLNEHLSEDAGEHGYCKTKNVFATASFIINCRLSYILQFPNIFHIVADRSVTGELTCICSI